MPQNAFFPRTRDLLVSQKTTQRHFPPVIFSSATVLAFVLLRSSRFNFHCYTQREATPTHKLAQKWLPNLSRLLAREITKGINSCNHWTTQYLTLNAEYPACDKTGRVSFEQSHYYLSTFHAIEVQMLPGTFDWKWALDYQTDPWRIICCCFC